MFIAYWGYSERNNYKVIVFAHSEDQVTSPMYISFTLKIPDYKSVVGPVYHRMLVELYRNK